MQLTQDDDTDSGICFLMDRTGKKKITIATPRELRYLVFNTHESLFCWENTFPTVLRHPSISPKWQKKQTALMFKTLTTVLVAKGGLSIKWYRSPHKKVNCRHGTVLNGSSVHEMLLLIKVRTEQRTESQTDFFFACYIVILYTAGAEGLNQLLSHLTV